ncbi:MASE1 domain-containing protein [Maridesulfovibrio zosterae]|uniref:MASE1 domain-containing protein n=1 Tax=Maridesulfovibrio zosterae TaxID=82171 RepID=UPI00040E0DA1|nr:MASE1 domain-containing protein [Maridesulfovibrio zosterae]
MGNIIKISSRNALVAFLYWGISYLNWLIFREVGVLPMPIWPAAGVAFVAAFYWKAEIGPGIALGTFFANHFILDASMLFALCISVMNSLAPVLGAYLIRKRVSVRLCIRNISDVAYVFWVGVCIVSFLSACGGIGSKYILGLLPEGVFVISLVRWAMSYAVGTMLLGLPFLVWIRDRTEK